MDARFSPNFEGNRHYPKWRNLTAAVRLPVRFHDSAIALCGLLDRGLTTPSAFSEWYRDQIEQSDPEKHKLLMGLRDILGIDVGDVGIEDDE